MKNIGIIGSGSFGCALANVLIKNHNVKIWSFKKEEADVINNEHRCMFIDNSKLDERIVCYTNYEDVIDDSEYLILVTPSSVIRNTCKNIKEYVKENKAMILDGFVYFRLRAYLEYLDEVVDSGVNQFVIEKEYREFISLLRVYVESKVPEYNLLHLIYINGESILLDEKRNIVSVSENIYNAKYLSDISFSSNDFALNTLLCLLPRRVEIHLIDDEDEFINTLKLIFEGRVTICKDCDICKTYKILNNAKISHNK